jgi:hypothetical protein
MSERSIRTAHASEAERCFAVLTLAFAGDPTPGGHGLIHNSMWMPSRALLEPSAGAPSMPVQPIMWKGSMAWPCGCCRGH